MKALIFLAHGSRREKSNQEVLDMVDTIRSPLANTFDVVGAAFLELIPPTLEDAVQQALDGGAQSILIYPFFLNSGKHVEQDIPAIVGDFQARYPDRGFEVARHFGAAEEIPGMIVGQIRNCI